MLAARLSCMSVRWMTLSTYMSGSCIWPQQFRQQHTDPVQASCATTQHISAELRGSGKIATHPLPILLGASRGDGKVDLENNPEKCKARPRRKNLELLPSVPIAPSIHY